MVKKVLGIFILIVIFGCAGNKPKDEQDFQAQFEKALKLLDKKKYVRAQEEFNMIVLKASHTDLGDDALFYLGESYFFNKEYILAVAEYDRLIRRMGFSPYIEKARWRICECYVAESPKYYHDQSYTQRALEKHQEFLDDYPASEYKEKADENIMNLREKLGKKAYEAGVLYIKLGAYDSAIIAFEDMLENYYDTSFVESAHIGIIRSYCGLLDVDKAWDYFESHENQFNTDQRNEAKGYITKAQKKVMKSKK